MTAAGLGLREEFSQQSGQGRAPSHRRAPQNSKGSVRWPVGMAGRETRH